MKNLLDYAVKVLNDDPNAVFVISRFHISFSSISLETDPGLDDDYRLLIEKLKKLPVHIFVLLLENDEIERRSLHHERNRVWKEHLSKKLNKSKFGTLKEMYADEQKKILKLLKEHGIPYTKMKLPI